MNKTIIKNTIIRVAVILLIPLIVLGVLTLLGEWFLPIIFVSGIALVVHEAYQKEKKDYEFRKKRSLCFHYQHIV